MTRKEQIKEVAQNEMSKYPNFCITAPAFRMGAEWADSHPHWISVEEELPPKEDESLDMSVDVLATNGNEVYKTFYDYYLQRWVRVDDFNLDDITHWMPLPQAPKKGGEHDTEK